MGDGVVEDLLGGAGLEGHGQPLDDFAGVRAYHVAAQHFLAVGVDHQLHQGLFLALGQGQFHGPEAAFVAGDPKSAFEGLLGGQADRADVGQAEDGGGDEVVVDLAVLLRAEQAARHGHAFGQRHGGERHAADHVADGEDGRLAGAVFVVHLDVAGLGQPHAGVLQAQVVEHGAPAGGVEDAIGFEHRAVGQRDRQHAIGALVDAFDVGIEAQVQAFLDQFVAQVLAHAAVEAAQEQFAPVDLHGLRAQAIENGGEFHRDVAAAHHQHPARQLGQEEGVVGRDGVFLARDVGHERPAAGGHQDVLRAVALPVDFDGVRVDDAGVAFVQRDAAVDQQVAVDAVQAFDFAVLVGDQRGPVELRAARVPAEAGRLLEVFVEMRAVDQQLLGHAAHVDAGAAQVAAFRHRHAGPVAGREARRAHAAGAGADDVQIEIKCHVCRSFRGRPRRPRV
ncbi:Uncharacterised protein [Bordetella pertussis]|nr:Uncharacterised protein [Bordetella pertussis]